MVIITISLVLIPTYLFSQKQQKVLTHAYYFRYYFLVIDRSKDKECNDFRVALDTDNFEKLIPIVGEMLHDIETNNTTNSEMLTYWSNAFGKEDAIFELSTKRFHVGELQAFYTQLLQHKILHEINKVILYDFYFHRTMKAKKDDTWFLKLQYILPYGLIEETGLMPILQQSDLLPRYNNYNVISDENGIERVAYIIDKHICKKVFKNRKKIDDKWKNDPVAQAFFSLFKEATKKDRVMIITSL